MIIELLSLCDKYEIFQIFIYIYFAVYKVEIYMKNVNLIF